MKHAFVALTLACTISGCAEMQAFATCALISGFANQRSYTFDGRVNGQKYKDTVTWIADSRDPDFFDPLDCTSVVSKRLREQEQQNARANVVSQPAQAIEQSTALANSKEIWE